jgi:hypothetical protein
MVLLGLASGIASLGLAIEEMSCGLQSEMFGEGTHSELRVSKIRQICHHLP